MWIASKHGWFSIVNKSTKGADTMVEMATVASIKIRARSRRDLDKLISFAKAKDPRRAQTFGLDQIEIEDTTSKDYCCQASVTAIQLSAIMEHIALDVDYPNFKEMIGDTPDQADKQSYYHDIWGIMFRYQMSQMDEDLGFRS